uniref:Uncharacterized protein n=1 Tax=Meloidogyne enterolobii TaxID=390850 RepID=A0A6V7TT87_MELEN|nr:unnamed protein product [Meloidogyne enterolobii]
MAKFFFILAIVAIVYLHLCDCGKKSSDKKDESKGNPSLRVKGGSIFKGILLKLYVNLKYKFKTKLKIYPN